MTEILRVAKDDDAKEWLLCTRRGAGSSAGSVVDFEGAVGVHDDCGFLVAAEGVVVHGGGHDGETAGDEGPVGGGEDEGLGRY
jgi:hypothetical protein